MEIIGLPKILRQCLSQDLETGCLKLAVGLDQAVTESHFCCSSLDIFLMEKVRKSCFIWLCRALKVLLNGPSSNFPRK